MTKYDIKLFKLFSVISYYIFLMKNFVKGYVWKFLKKYTILVLKVS